MKKSIKIDCPNCQKEMLWSNDNPFRPFCSERCKLIDFGDWINGERVICGESTEIIDDDLNNHSS